MMLNNFKYGDEYFLEKPPVEFCLGHQHTLEPILPVLTSRLNYTDSMLTLILYPMSD